MVGWMAVTIFTIVIGLSIVGIQLWLALFLTIVDWSLKVFLSTKIGTQNICASIQVHSFAPWEKFLLNLFIYKASELKVRL